MALSIYVGFPNTAKPVCSAVFQTPIDINRESHAGLYTSTFIAAAKQGLRGSPVLEIGAIPVKECSLLVSLVHRHNNMSHVMVLHLLHWHRRHKYVLQQEHLSCFYKVYYLLPTRLSTHTLDSSLECIFHVL